MSKNLARKAVVYCLQRSRLLVFRHVDVPWEEVGIQVPAGGIRAGETPQDAALRELVEETCRSCFRIEAFLGTSWYDISPYRHELQERHFFLARPTQPLPERWPGAENHDGAKAPTRFECFWIPLKHGHVLQSGQGAMLWRIGE